MDANETETPLTERKVVRRGLLAGLAGLGAAAMLKVSGADKVSAADGGPMLLGSSNTASSLTQLSATRDGSAFIVTQAGFSANSQGLTASCQGVQPAIIGTGYGGAGVFGQTAANQAYSGTAGVVGTDTGFLLPNANLTYKRGVYGSSNQIGVHGRSGASAFRAKESEGTRSACKASTTPEPTALPMGTAVGSAFTAVPAPPASAYAGSRAVPASGARPKRRWL